MFSVSVSNLVIGRRILSCKLQLSDDDIIGRHLQFVHVLKKFMQISIVQTLNCLADQGTVNMSVWHKSTRLKEKITFKNI